MVTINLSGKRLLPGLVDFDKLDAITQATINSLLAGSKRLAYIADVQTDATLNPGASPAAGTRYLLLDAASLKIPVVGSVLNGDSGTYQQIPGMAFSTRNNAFNQLDVRVDKTWTFSRWNLNLYLEILNVYNAANAEGVQYNYNFTQSQTVSGIPFFPNLGVRGEF